MHKCLCCNKKSRGLMGPTCAVAKCKCKGMYCLHDETRLKLYRIHFEIGGIHYPDLELVKCDKCGCAWTGHPDSSTLQGSFTCKHVLDSIRPVTLVSY